MSTVVIFANGLPPTQSFLKSQVKGDEILIAVDNGATHCMTAGFLPNLLIGDLDSLPQDLLKVLQQKNIAIEKYPVAKDKIDLELALEKAVSLGADTIKILASFGGRWDMSLAVFHLLALPDFCHQNIIVLDERQKAFTITPQKPAVLLGEKHNCLSLLPLTSKTAGIKSEGLLYPLQNHTLTFGSTCGVSNALCDSEAYVQVQEGILLCVYYDESFIS